jgi:hypothetical protein
MIRFQLILLNLAMIHESSSSLGFIKVLLWLVRLLVWDSMVRFHAAVSVVLLRLLLLRLRNNSSQIQILLMIVESILSDIWLNVLLVNLLSIFAF